MERIRILELIETGDLNVDQGLHLLEDIVDEGQIKVEDLIHDPSISFESTNLQDEYVSESLPVILKTNPEPQAGEIYGQEASIDAEDDAQFEGKPAVQPAVMPGAADAWRRWWMVPLWIGVGLAVTGGLLMTQAQRTSGIGFWFFLAGVPFLLGLLLIVFGLESRSWPWLYLRVEQPAREWAPHFTFSMPIPAQPVAGFLSRFGRFIPHLEADSLNQVIQAIGETTCPENPICIEVEDKDGERVEIYIG